MIGGKRQRRGRTERKRPPGRKKGREDKREERKRREGRLIKHEGEE